MSDVMQQLLSAVEEQLRSPQTPYVKATYDRLIADGMSDEEAREEIADCLGHELDEMLEQGRAFQEKSYRSLLDALPWQEKPQSGNDLQNL